MRAVLADFSRLLNRMTGGEPGKTLCWRMAMRFGHDCLFCRAVGFVLRERAHCREELRR
jgi:hypothetical protein